MKRWAFILVVAFVGVGAWPQSDAGGRSLSDSMAKEQLAGVPGFLVQVFVSDDLASLLPKSSIKTDVELKLRIAHIPVLDEQSSPNSNGGVVQVAVRGVRATVGPLWAISMTARCIQGACLIREPRASTLGLSWEEGNVFVGGEGAIPQLREDIKDWIDEFVNLYLAANQ